MYYINGTLSPEYSCCFVNITRSINRIIGDKVPYSQFTKHTKIAYLDAILYGPTADIVDDHHNLDSYCQLNIICYYNPVVPILFGMMIFLVTLFIQVLLLHCIYRI